MAICIRRVLPKERRQQLELWCLATESARPELPPKLAIPSTPGKVGRPEPMIGIRLAGPGLGWKRPHRKTIRVLTGQGGRRPPKEDSRCRGGPNRKNPAAFVSEFSADGRACGRLRHGCEQTCGPGRSQACRTGRPRRYSVGGGVSAWKGDPGVAIRLAGEKWQAGIC